MAEDTIKKADQLALLDACREKADTGKPIGVFTYPNCGWDLVQSGLVNEDTSITIAGRAALWLTGKSPTDPFPESKSFESFSIPIPEKI